MLVLFSVIITGGIIAGRILPNYGTQQKRTMENHLRATLAEIRQAFDLKQITLFPKGEDYNPDLSSPDAIDIVLKNLESENFLRSALMTDPTVSPDNWGPGNIYWKGSSNILYNSSFESNKPPDSSKGEFVASWSFGTSDSVGQLSIDNDFYPTMDTNQIDDYRGQNKLGLPLTASGTALKIIH